MIGTRLLRCARNDKKLSRLRSEIDWALRARKTYLRVLCVSFASSALKRSFFHLGEDGHGDVSRRGARPRPVALAGADPGDGDSARRFLLGPRLPAGPSAAAARSGAALVWLHAA